MGVAGKGWRTVAGAAMAAGTLAAMTSGAARAAEPGPLELVADGARGAIVSQTGPRPCPTATAGTAGMTEPVTPTRDLPDRGNGLSPGDSTTAPSSLPGAVYLRSTTATYNRRYWFALARGRIYYRSNAEVTGIRQPWAPLHVPGCLRGRVSGISADDDELVALDRRREVFTMDGALGDPRFFNWTVRWGPPFWTGPGRTIPNGIAWSWSVSSPREDGSYTDSAGNSQPVGDFKVSHIWLLGHDGQRLTYMDPWLPRDRSYEMCGPERGRFRSVAMSASGSTVFVMNRLGDMFTRLYDFDISGADSLFLRYSYADQRGRPNPAIQLPSPGWVRQPKVPGRITSAISVEKEGRGSVHRILRVEGSRGGRTGFWQRDIADPSRTGWTFTPTRQPLTRRPLRNPRRDTARRGLGPSDDVPFAMHSQALTAELPNFNLFCSPARLVVRLDADSRVRMVLHTVDAIRQTPRAPGLDSNPRLVQGTIEAPRSVLRSHDPDVRDFVGRYLDGRFTDAPIEATRRRLRFRDQGWLFRRESPARRVPGG